MNNHFITLCKSIVLVYNTPGAWYAMRPEGEQWVATVLAPDGRALAALPPVATPKEAAAALCAAMQAHYNAAVARAQELLAAAAHDVASQP